ncbi:MAG: LysM peptidoglycan-binding domain-containing C40 family peptidase [Fimbriimonadales bacterium]|nr:LysM peptidoglycan-binding domain-containing C40 family peptidase [Fimbriimonadales bacterium]
MVNLTRSAGLIALLVNLIIVASAQQTIRYTVKEGDSLYAIAHRFGLRLPDLLKVNHFRNPHKLKPGDVVRIPVKGAVANRKPSRSAHSQLARRNPSRAAMLLELSGKADRSEPSRPNGSVTARRVLEIASRYLGRPYRYGGSSSRGFDCSGFALHVYRSVGVNLPHSSSAQARVGKPVPRHQLQPGDLVFFRTRGRRISHVGIYIGNGKFIHASSARGRVRIDSLNEGYYKRRYAGARRVSR